MCRGGGRLSAGGGWEGLASDKSWRLGPWTGQNQLEGRQSAQTLAGLVVDNSLVLPGKHRRVTAEMWGRGRHWQFFGEKMVMNVTEEEIEGQRG